MYSLNPSLHIFLKLSKITSIIHRKFEGPLNGLSFTEFTILLHLSKAPEERLRMTDVAEKVGLTPSGITRILLPMEKIGLISKERNPHDARSSMVVLSTSGKTRMTDTLVHLEEHCEELTSVFSSVELDDTLASIKKLGACLHM